MEGRYVFIVADLSHVVTPYTMSVCTIAIFGSGYRREEPLPASLELTQGETMTLTVPHIYTEYDTGVVHVIQLRQPEDKIIDFVSFEELSSSSTSNVQIDTKDVVSGDYELVLQSYNILSDTQLTLMTDIIKITVIKELEPKVEALTKK